MIRSNAKSSHCRATGAVCIAQVIRAPLKRNKSSTLDRLPSGKDKLETPKRFRTGVRLATFAMTLVSGAMQKIARGLRLPFVERLSEENVTECCKA
jgi:hypothetical protein